jgi:hypothetical protein
MSKDGPPISSGYRYGTLNAFRANLSAEALKPRGVVTEADARARQNLSDFAAYPARAKSIGKPLPVPQGVSPRRAAVLNRIAELAEQENALRSVTISEGDRYILKLVFGGSSKSYRFYEEDLALGMNRYSLPYGSRDQAKLYYRLDRIRWYPWRNPEFRSVR